jgi:hypothetical protein
LPLCSGDFDLLLDDAEVGMSNISVGNSSDVSLFNISESGPQQLQLPESAGLYLLQISTPSSQIVERIIKL